MVILRFAVRCSGCMARKNKEIICNVLFISDLSDFIFQGDYQVCYDNIFSSNVFC
jgi:hypothetical protein